MYFNFIIIITKIDYSFCFGNLGSYVETNCTNTHKKYMVLLYLIYVII